MNNTNGIETLALIGKSIVESSSMDRNNKEWAKLGIEGFELFLKSLRSSENQEQASVGSAFEQIRLIKEAARQCSVKRVVAFPINDNGQIKTLFRLYEGNWDEFCNRLGLTRMDGRFNAKESAELVELERQYGIILYERD